MKPVVRVSLWPGLAIDLGHTEIRHVAGPAESMDALERVRGGTL